MQREITGRTTALEELYLVHLQHIHQEHLQLVHQEHFPHHPHHLGYPAVVSLSVHEGLGAVGRVVVVPDENWGVAPSFFPLHLQTKRF